MQDMDEVRRDRLGGLLDEENCRHQEELAEIRRLEKLPRKLRNSPSPAPFISSYHSPTQGRRSRSNSGFRAQSRSPSPFSQLHLETINTRNLDMGIESPRSPLNPVESFRSNWDIELREQEEREKLESDESRKIDDEMDSMRNQELTRFHSNKADIQKEYQDFQKEIDQDNGTLKIIDLKIQNFEHESRELSSQKEKFLNAKRSWYEGSREHDHLLNRGSLERQSRLMLKKKKLDRMRTIDNDRKAIQHIETFLNSVKFENSPQRMEKIEGRIHELKCLLDLHQKLEENREREESTCLFEEEGKKVSRDQNEGVIEKEKNVRSLLLEEIYTDFEQHFAEIEFRNAKDREKLFEHKNRLSLSIESMEKNVAFIEKEFRQDFKNFY